MSGGLHSNRDIDVGIISVNCVSSVANADGRQTVEGVLVHLCAAATAATAAVTRMWRPGLTPCPLSVTSSVARPAVATR